MNRQPLTEAEKQLPYADFYDRPSAIVSQDILDTIENGPHRPEDTLPFDRLNDLLSPGYLPMETGHCRMPNGSFFVAVRTELPPDVTRDMINWWFDWHPREPLRYRIWFPEYHYDTSIDYGPDKAPGDLPHWHTTHYPVEDIGLGSEKIAIRFLPPAEFGFDTSRFEAAGIETVICGFVGVEANKTDQAVQMCHLVRRTERGLEMRSRFWMGNEVVLSPFFGSKLAEKLVNSRFMRHQLMPDKTGYVMAMHCAQEYANLGEILPELYERFG